MSSKRSKTVVRESQWNGRPVLEIWVVDDKGQNRYERPLISFGVQKAKALLEHIDQIQNFAATKK